jgi:hypothetical protein
MEKEHKRDGFARLGSDLDSDESGSIIRSPNHKMELSKGTLISIFIIVLTVAIGGFLLYTKKDTLFNKKDTATTPLSSVQLKFTEKNFKLDYSSLSSDFVYNIANFEKNEDWQGEHELNDVIFWQGGSSMVLESKDNVKTESYLAKKIDLSKYQIFKIAVYLQTDPQDLESVKLYFANKDKTAYFTYPITNLTKGWNFLDIPKMKFSSVNATKENLMNTTPKITSAAPSYLLNWDKIERVGAEVTSRPNSTTTVNFDDLKALESEDYLDDWLTVNPLFLDLVKSADDKIVIQARSTALIKKISGVSTFTFKAKLLPLKPSARSGFFIRGDYRTNYGYYFLVDGINGNRWQVFKIGLVDGVTATTMLKNGVINNFMVEQDKPLWLKAEAKGDNMKFYLSTDNKSFTKLGEINDSDIKEGGVGITVFDGGATLFDEMEFSQ